MRLRLVIPVEPMGAVRMTGRGKWTSPAAQRYLDYKAKVGWEAKRQLDLEVPLEGAIRIREIVFYMPIPKDGRAPYREKGERKLRKVAPGDYHMVRPDIDNLFKGVTDSLNGVVWEDDSLICEVGRQVKVYGEEPRIEIEIEEANV